MIYQVTVTDEDGVTVMQLTAPAEVLQEFADYAVMKAIGADEKAADEQTSSGGNDAPRQPRTRRPRRTKAEMQAAREAEAINEERAEDPVPDVVPDQGGYNPFANKA